MDLLENNYETMPYNEKTSIVLRVRFCIVGNDPTSNSIISGKACKTLAVECARNRVGTGSTSFLPGGVASPTSMNRGSA